MTIQPDAAAVPEPGTGYLSLRSVTKKYESLTAVDALTLDVAKGEMVAFLGPSGCGKTPSLRMIAGLSQVTSGAITIDGRDVTHAPAHKRDIGLVFQNYALFPHMKVLQNVMFGLEVRGVERKEARRRAMEAIELVRLGGRENHRPSQLSGGQQQRVALARALVIRPAVLLLDEPLSNLDAKLRDEMRSEIREIQKSLGITAIFVTHDQVEALSISDRVAVMEGGRLEQIGTPFELYERPATRFVAGFVGRSNTLEGVADGEHVLVAGHAIRTRVPCHGEVAVMIRPHRIQILTAAPVPEGDALTNAVPGTVRNLFYAGDVLQYTVDTRVGLMTVETSTTGDARPLAPGTPVVLQWKADDTLAYEKRP